MIGVRRAIAVALLLFATGTASVHAVEAIRDIYGPVQSSGLPPFAVTAVLVLVALAWRGISRSRSNMAGKVVLPVSETDRLHDELVSLRVSYLRGELSELQVFDRLASVVRSLVPCADPSALTSEELVALARENIPAEVLNRIEPLLTLCDKVRFGGYVPDKVVATKALDDVLDAVRGRLERTL